MFEISSSECRFDQEVLFRMTELDNFMFRFLKGRIDAIGEFARNFESWLSVRHYKEEFLNSIHGVLSNKKVDRASIQKNKSVSLGPGSDLEKYFKELGLVFRQINDWASEARISL